MTILNEDLLFQIYSIVEEIPQGKVATYGQIAKLSGYDKNSRLVGKAIKYAELYGSFPCHRVVNHEGRLAPNFPNQKELLINEGVSFKQNGNVNLKQYKWETK